MAVRDWCAGARTPGVCREKWRWHLQTPLLAFVLRRRTFSSPLSHSPIQTVDCLASGLIARLTASDSPNHDRDAIVGTFSFWRKFCFPSGRWGRSGGGGGGGGLLLVFLSYLQPRDNWHRTILSHHGIARALSDRGGSWDLSKEMWVSPSAPDIKAGGRGLLLVFLSYLQPRDNWHRTILSHHGIARALSDRGGSWDLSKEIWVSPSAPDIKAGW